MHIRQLFTDLDYLSLTVQEVGQGLEAHNGVTPVLVTGAHLSARGASAVVSRYCSLATFALAAKWIPATRAGTTLVAVARLEV